jgi:uncharacterized protein involved in tellurium resistance
MSGQNGGKTIFQILDLAPSARSLALGGKYISVRDSDVTLAQFNPAIASASGTHQLNLNQSFYFTGSSYSNLGIAHYLDKQQITLSGGILFLQHGDIQAADEYGNKTGTFKANEFAILAGASKKLFDPLTIGINLKFISSQIEAYKSTGIGIDLGALYNLKGDHQTLGLAVRNIGTQWSPYQNEKEALPLDVMLGYTQRLEHVPFILSINAHHLQQWNLRYDNPDAQTTILGEPVAGPSALSKSVDNAVRHLIFGAEILLGRYAPVRLRLSYNHQRHQELKDQSYGGLSGFAGGFGIRMNRLSFDYALANYNIAGSVHALGLSYRWR